MGDNIPNKPYIKADFNKDYEIFKRAFVSQFETEPRIFNEEIRHISEGYSGDEITYFFEIEREGSILAGKKLEEAFYKKGRKAYSGYIARKPMKIWLEENGASYSCYFDDIVSISY